MRAAVWPRRFPFVWDLDLEGKGWVVGFCLKGGARGVLLGAHSDSGYFKDGKNNIFPETG